MRQKKNRGFSIHNEGQRYFKTLDPNEAVILSFLPSKWKWITRDQNGDLMLYDLKPCKHPSGAWIPSRSAHIIDFPYRQMFKMIKWSDDDPTNIDKLLKENIEYAITRRGRI